MFKDAKSGTFLSWGGAQGRCPRRILILLCLSPWVLLAQNGDPRVGTTDPAGNPQHLTLFRDQQVFVMSTGTKTTPWQTNVVSFDGKLNPTGSVSQLPWSGALPWDQVAIQAVAGRFLTPAKDDIALVQRSESNANDLLLRFQDGSLPTTLSSSFAAREPSWSDFFATSAGDLDRLYDAKGNYHDEVAVAWIEQEPGSCSGLSVQGSAVPHVAVVNYNDPTHPAVVSQRLDRADGQYASYCVIDYFDSPDTKNFNYPRSVLQPNDNLVATAIGDFDGDGFNELAVAYLRGRDGIVISVVIYRYQNDGTNASLTPVNTFEIYNPTVGMVGTLSLTAGDFNGSGFDQLMVGSAYWAGISNPDGTYQRGTLVTQPVVILITGGQTSGTVSNAVSAGAGTATTNVTVALGQGAYVPQTVTISGAIGSWTAMNGTWQVTPTATGFSLPVDSSQFETFNGQSVQVSVAAPLAQTDRVLVDAFPSLPGYSPGPIGIDDADRDGRIRVQLAAGLFHYAPKDNFDIRRRQVAMLWNARPAPGKDPFAAEDGDSHLALLQVINGKVVQSYLGNGLMKGFQTFQTLSVAAGAFRGDNSTNDPTWSLFLSGVGQAFNTANPGTNTLAEGVVSTVLSVSSDTKDVTKLSASPICYGKASGDPNPPAYYGFVPPVCQLWGDDARMESPTGVYPFAANNYLRLPVIAADLNGNSLKLGAPMHFTLTDPGKADFILEQPPQHSAFLDLGSGAQVVTINRYPTFNTTMQDSQGKDFASKGQDHTDLTIGGSQELTASARFTAGVDVPAVEDVDEQTGVDVKVKVAYDYDHVHTNYDSNYSAYTVGKGAVTGQDDSLIMESQIFDIWRYRIYGQGSNTGDPKNPNSFYNIVIPGPSIASIPGGRDVEWYQPIHEVGNILSYPEPADVCNPSDIGPITITHTDISNQAVPLIKCSQVFYNGNTSTLSLMLTHQTGGGESTDYTHKLHGDVDVSLSYQVDFQVLGNGGHIKGTSETDIHGGGDWGHLQTSDYSTTDATGITLNSPQGDSQYAYPYWPIFYDTTSGALKVAYAVGDLRASSAGSTFWTDNYGAKPDPALNLPNRFQATYSHNNVLNGWAPVTTIARKRMKGFVIRQAALNPVTNIYPILARNPQDGDTVMLDARVYNYSLSSTPTGPITVRFSVIPYDSERDNEICPGIPTTGKGGRVCPASARTVIGVGSSAPTGGAQTISLNSRQNAEVYLKWNTKGFGPQGAGVNDYRVYVDLISDPSGPGELYPPEAPCTAVPCEDNFSNEPSPDPGQNNEGWSLISVEAPKTGLQGGAPGATEPEAAQLTLGSNTPLLGGPEGSFLTANLGQPLPLRLSAFSSTPTPLYSNVTIYDGKPRKPNAEGKPEKTDATVAVKIVRGARPEGATVWQDWTPVTLLPHYLYATVQNRNGSQPLGSLLVDVQRTIGDLNGDSRVDRHDLNVLERDFGKSVAESACGTACDIDGDGQITQTDSLLMANLCDSLGCAFDKAEYMGGGASPLEPDMRAQRAADLAARTAWLAAHPEAQGVLHSAPPVSFGLFAYREELARKQALHSVRHYYKGQPVTTGPLAAWPPMPPAQTVIYAKPATREGTEVQVPLVVVNDGSGPISALDLTKLSVNTAAGTGQATVLGSNFSLPPGSSFLPGASVTVSVRLRVPATVQKFELIERGTLRGSSGSSYQFGSGQIIAP